MFKVIIILSALESEPTKIEAGEYEVKRLCDHHAKRISNDIRNVMKSSKEVSESYRLSVKVDGYCEKVMQPVTQ